MNDAVTHLLRDYAALAERSMPSKGVNPIAGGVTHSSWRMPGGPIFMHRATGVRKWDGAGRPYVDLWMGHGALLLGNAHPAVVDAVSRQIALGQHVGGAHVLQVQWAERIQASVPSCESIRFTSSGTEGTLLALRIARAWTNRDRIVRIDGHFHGWHDECLVHIVAETCGLNAGVSGTIVVVPPMDIGSISEALTGEDIAAVILEPGGGSAGSLPWSPEYLRTIRRICNATGTLLIFDEVISGFRYAPGGVQALAGVSPDLTVLAKIAAGGMPGALVGGKREIMNVFAGCEVAHGRTVVPHTGTFNGFPVSAAAALATLDLVNDGSAQAQAESATVALVQGVNREAQRAGVDVRLFNQSSVFHILIGAFGEGVDIAPGPAAIRLPRQHASAYELLRCALLLEGVDCHSSHGWLSASHQPGDIDEAIAGFDRAFRRVRDLQEFRAPPVAQHAVIETCGSICRKPDCGARLRLFAGCSRPLDLDPRKMDS